MDKAQSYLYNRLNMLSQEKMMLITKINEIDLEAEETENAMKNLKEEIDDAFEIFSPRSKKNDFIRNEITSLQEKLKNLSTLRNEYVEQIKMVDDDVDIINDALGVTVEDIDDYCDFNELGELDDNLGEENIYDKSIDIKDTRKICCDFLEYQETEKDNIAVELQNTALQSLTNLVYKTEMCNKVIDLDPMRTKLEIEVMRKSILEIIDNLTGIINRLNLLAPNSGDIYTLIEKIIKNTKTEKNIIFKHQNSIHIKDYMEKIILVKIIQSVIDSSTNNPDGKDIVITLDNIYSSENNLSQKNVSQKNVSRETYSLETGMVVLKFSGNGVDFNLPDIIDNMIRLLNGKIEVKSDTDENDKTIEVLLNIPDSRDEDNVCV